MDNNEVINNENIAESVGVKISAVKPTSKSKQSAPKSARSKVAAKTTKPTAKASSKKPTAKTIAITKSKTTIKSKSSASKSAVKPTAKKLTAKSAAKRKLDALNDEYGLKLFCQPIYDVSENRVYGYEALLRIVDRDLGVITPDMFLAVAKKNNSLIRGLEDWSMAELFKTSELFRKKKKYIEYLSLNVETSTFIRADFYDKISKYFDKLTENIFLELKEDAFFSISNDVIMNNITKLRENGVKIAVDDFTANFLTFDWGEIMPFDIIKIERSYIDRFLISPKAKLIVEKIIEFARERNLDIIAVGVENQEQEQALLDMGCKKMQGYYYSKPTVATKLV